MTSPRRWTFDETRLLGVDYTDPGVADRFDARFRQLGDPTEWNEAILDRLGVGPETHLLDMGAGTGTFALQAARRCGHVYAVDLAQPMLDRARAKAKEAGVRNLELHRAGFLTYQHQGPPLDVVTTSAALHHLPDFWKLVALKRLAALLKEGGKLYLMDAVYSFGPKEDHEAVFEQMMERQFPQVDASFAQDIHTDICREYMTMDWVLEGLLTRAGFDIEEAVYAPTRTSAVYWCRKAATCR